MTAWVSGGRAPSRTGAVPRRRARTVKCSGAGRGHMMHHDQPNWRLIRRSRQHLLTAPRAFVRVVTTVNRRSFAAGPPADEISPERIPQSRLATVAAWGLRWPPRLANWRDLCPGCDQPASAAPGTPRYERSSSPATGLPTSHATGVRRQRQPPSANNHLRHPAVQQFVR
jgi:hypothetical protein